MGQYHHVTNMTLREHVSARALNSGIKAWEIIANSSSIPSALAILMAAGPGERPGDLGFSPITGRWAGTAIAAVGDYTEAGDVPGWPFGIKIENVYKLCSDEQIALDEAPDPKRRHLKDVATALWPTLEVLHNIRYHKFRYRGSDWDSFESFGVRRMPDGSYDLPDPEGDVRYAQYLDPELLLYVTSGRYTERSTNLAVGS